MVGKKNQSALLAKYFGMYKKNPRSKVFAPLAESYRKLGMLDEAFKILKEGIRFHPNYTLGYIVLAHCYYDQQKYELTHNTLRPIISQNGDNISLQKIYAQACMHLGYLDEALDIYKYLLFMNPRDKFFAEQVKKLEDDLMIGHKKLNIEQLIKAPDVQHLQMLETSEDDWVQVSFNPEKQTPAQNKPQLPAPEATDEHLDQWVIKQPGAEISQHPILKEEKIQERDLEDEYYADEFEEEFGDIDEVNAESLNEDSPLISHTLIDLYCAQEYFDKAIELLEKILESNPGDAASVAKMKQVKELKLAHTGKPQLKVVDEQEGHDELISIIENQVKSKSPKEVQVEKIFNHFLDALKERALEIHG